LTLIQLNLWGLNDFEDLPSLPGILRGHGEVLLAAGEQGRTDSLSASLGLNPRAHPVEVGPLLVACHRAGPPPRSVHLALSPLSLSPEGKLERAPALEPKEWDEIRAAAQWLATKDLTVLAEPDALVWERGSLDMGMISAPDAIGTDYLSARPEGDGERLFRRLIDDSANLLSELDCYRKRLDEGKPTVDLWWPWGPGFEPRWPNLPLRHGVPIRQFTSNDLMAGAAILAKISSQKSMTPEVIAGGITILDDSRLLDPDPERALHTLEQQIWPWIEKQVELHRKQGLALVIMDPAPRSERALAARFQWPDRLSNGVPFETRTRIDAGAPLVNLWEFVSESWHLAFAPPTSA